MEDIREISKNQLIRGGDYRKTICEIFRLVYDEIHEMEDKNKKEKITELLVDGIMMGAKMHRRLKYYFKKYKDDSGSKGETIEKLPGSHNRRRWRQQRVICKT